MKLQQKKIYINVSPTNTTTLKETRNSYFCVTLQIQTLYHSIF